jgi:hypothetical protein
VLLFQFRASVAVEIVEILNFNDSEFEAVAYPNPFKISATISYELT